MMNKITTPNDACALPTFASLIAGTCYKYRSGKEIYMKCAPVNYEPATIQLRNGTVFTKPRPESEVIVVKHVVIDAENC